MRLNVSLYVFHYFLSFHCFASVFVILRTSQDICVTNEELFRLILSVQGWLMNKERYSKWSFKCFLTSNTLFTALDHFIKWVATKCAACTAGTETKFRGRDSSVHLLTCCTQKYILHASSSSQSCFLKLTFRHTNTQNALLSAVHVQEDGIPEHREKVQSESRQRERQEGGLAVTGWRYGKYSMEPLLSDQGTDWRKDWHYYCTAWLL